LFSIAFVSASQTYVQEYLSPFYRASTTANQNYTYVVAVSLANPFDRITTAILSFDVYITPTVVFTLWVDEQRCNTADYTISTTYSGSSQARIRFDCSNIINHTGIYTVKMSATRNTGSIVGWLDIAYVNIPPPIPPEVSGTEYLVGDMMTAFVQLKDSQGLPVTNGSCYIDVYYPFNGTVHPYVIRDAPMLNAGNDDGLYYYDMIAPNYIGVYMLSAKCSFAYNWVWIYPEDEVIYFPQNQRESGTWLANNSQVLNSMTDSQYEKCSITAGVPCVSNYSFNVNTYGNVTNITSINIYYSGQSDVATRTLTISYWNGSTFVNMVNTLTYAGTAISSPQNPSAIDEFLTNTIPVTAIQGGIVKLRLTTNTGLARVYHNWLSLALLTTSGTIQEVKGSGEFHVVYRISNQSVSDILLNCFMGGNCTGWWINSTLQEITDQNELNYQVLQALTSNVSLLQDYVMQVLNNQSYWLPNLNISLAYISNNLTYHFPLLESQHQQILDNMTAYAYALNNSLMQIPMLVWEYPSKNLTYVDWETGALFVWNSTGNNRTLTYTNQSISESIADCLNTGNCAGWWLLGELRNISDYALDVYDVVHVINDTQEYWFANISQEINITQEQIIFLQATVDFGFSNLPNITSFQELFDLVLAMNDTISYINDTASYYYPLFDGLLVNISDDQDYYYPLFNALLYNILSNQTIAFAEFHDALINIMANQSYQYDQFEANFSNLTGNEMLIISLLYSMGAHGSDDPVVQDCDVNDTMPECGDVVRFQCNITDDDVIAGVAYTFGGVNYAPTANGSIYYLDLTFSGMYQIPQFYNWTNVEVTDAHANSFDFPQNQIIEYNCVNLTDQLICYGNTEPFLKQNLPFSDRDQIDWVCHLKRAEAECISEVYYGENLLQTNPEPETIEGIGEVSTYHLNGAEEHFFHAWFTKDNLIADVPVNFTVRCNDGYNDLQYSQVVTPTYKDWEGIAQRAVWAKENIGLLIGLVIVILIIVLIIRIIVRRL
jgi:hypothetical protein